MSETSKTIAGWRDAVKNRVKHTVKTLYFPEVWYTIENFFQVAPQKNVLDVGSGNGLVAEAFGKSAWQVTMVDPSVSCLRLAQKRFALAGLAGRFEQCDPDKLPFADQSYAFVTSINMLEFSENPRAVIAEIARILTPGGRAVIASFNRRSPWALGSIAKIVRRDYRLGQPRFLTKDQLVTFVREAGLTIETVSKKARYLPTSTRVSRIHLPVTGCFVLLVHKPLEGDSNPASSGSPQT